MSTSSNTTCCQVCGDVLQDWSQVLFKGKEEGPKDIEVTVGSVTKKINTSVTTKNSEDFQKHIRRAFSLKAEDVRSSDVTFDVSIPDVDYTIKLRGWDHFEAVFGEK
jgi:hypothetical protein